MKNLYKALSVAVFALLLSVSASAGNDDVRIFPNPANDVLNIEILPHSILGDEVVVTLYDLLGNVVLREQCSVGIKTVKFPDDMPAGMYIVTFEDINSKVRTTKRMQKK
jgi:hypothetical protein